MSYPRRRLPHRWPGLAALGWPVLLVGAMLLLQAAHTPTAQAAPMTGQVITLPYLVHDLTAPHPAYRGRFTRAKAIARGTPCETPYFRWDMDDDGTWDTCNDSPGYMTDGQGRFWYQTNRYNIDCARLMLADQWTDAASERPLMDHNAANDWPGGRRRFLARVQVTCDPNDNEMIPREGTYPIMVFADVARHMYNGFVVNAHYDLDTEEYLNIKRVVSVEDGLWYGHKQLARANVGLNTHTAAPYRTNCTDTNDCSRQAGAVSAMLWGLSQNGHLPTYPPGTYRHQPGNEAAIPDSFSDYEYRYRVDPLAEDAGMLLNYLINSQAGLQQDPWHAAEGAYSVGSSGHGGASNYLMGHVLGALGATGVGDTWAQVTSPNGAREQISVIVGKLVHTLETRQSTCACNLAIADPNADSSCMADGGWEYMAKAGCSTSSVDGSSMQWVMIGLEAAQRGMGIEIPDGHKGRMTNSFWYNTKRHGVFAGAGSYRNSYRGHSQHDPHLAGGLLVSATLLGINEWSADENCIKPWPNMRFDSCELRQNFDMVVEYLGKSWEVNNSRGDISWMCCNYAHRNARYGVNAAGNGREWRQGNSYSLYSVQKGLMTAGIDTIRHYDNVNDAGPDDPEFDWLKDITVYSLNNQHSDGSLIQAWCPTSAPTCQGHMWNTHQNSWAEVLVLSESVFNPPPVAAALAEPVVRPAGCIGGPTDGRVTFGHSPSYHPSASRSVTMYQWQFDVDPANVDWSLFPDALPDGQRQVWVTNNAGERIGWMTDDLNAQAVWVYQQAPAGAAPYRAALRVIDNTPAPEGPLDNMVLTHITIQEQAQLPPEANAHGPYVIVEGDDLDVEGEIGDPNLLCYPDTETVSGSWDFTDDGAAQSHFALPAGTVPWATLEGENLTRNQPLEILLTAVDSTARTATSNTQLTIYERAPRACLTAIPQQMGCGDALDVDAGCSRVIDPRRNISRYEWMWDSLPLDDPNFVFAAAQVGRALSHTYANLGEHRVTLRVEDTWGNAAFAQQVVTLEARDQPIAVAAPPADVLTVLEGGVRVGTDLVLDGSNSSDPDSPCGDSVVAYEWDLNGDGVFTDAAGARPVVPWDQLQALFAARGWTEANYIANPDTGLPRVALRLRVRDTTGATALTQVNLTIWDNAPVASFTVSPRRSACNQAIQFDATSSSHGHPEHVIDRYDWDFDVPQVAGGDPVAIIAAFQRDAAGAQLEHAYPSFGTYHPVLRVTDDQGRIAYYWGDDVTVDQGNSPPEADAGGPYVLAIGGNLTLDATGTVEPDSGCGDTVVRYEWDLNGDGVFGDLGLDSANPVVIWGELAPLLQTPAQYPANPLTGVPRITVAVETEDMFGATQIGEANLTVYGRDPVAVPVWNPRPFVPITGQQLATIRLDGSGSYHQHPNFQVVSWAWSQENGVRTVQGEQADFEVDLAAYEIPEGGLDLTFELQVADNSGRTDTSSFTVSFNYAPSDPPNIAFGVGREGVFVQTGEGFGVSAAGTSDPDGDWIDVVEWDLDGDGVTDIRHERQDTNNDGRIDGSDANPPMALDLTWEEMAQYGLQGLGEHTLTLTVTDSTSTQASDDVKLTVVEAAILAEASVAPQQGGCQTVFNFDGGQSRHVFPDGEIVSYRWDFDGNGVWDINREAPSHTFGTFGTFNVRLRVEDLDGHFAEDTITVTTENGNRPPVPVTGGPYFADSGERNGLDLDASGSTEPDVACGDRIVTYRWDLDNVLGGNGERSWEVVTADPQIHLDWAAIAGLPQGNPDHPIVLQVEDSLHGVAESATTLLIDDGTPVPSFELVPQQVGCGSPITVDATASYHPVPGRRIVSLRWDFDYDAGQGFQASDLHEDQREFQFVFDSMGEHTVALRVVDDMGVDAMATRTASVSGDNVAPLALTGGELVGTVGQPLVLDGSASRDPNAACGDAIVLYEWDIDPNTPGYEIQSADAETSIPWVQVQALNLQQADPFTGEPSYPLSLRVSDRLGAQGTLDTRLRLYEVRPVGRATVRPPSAQCGTQMEFDGRASYNTHPDHGIVSHVWDFDIEEDSDGDNIPDNDVDASGGQVYHQYQRMNGEGGCPVQFSIDATDQPVSSVVVAGTFNNWGGDGLADAWTLNNDAGTVWSLPVLLDPGNYEYKFVFLYDPGDPWWRLDPANPNQANGNSVLNVACANPDFQAAPHRAQLTVTDDQGTPTSVEVQATLAFQNFQPVADPGDFYVTGVINDGGAAPVNLDGSGSYDSNAPCDGIALYQWDTDGDGLFGSDDLDGAPWCAGPGDCEGETVQLDGGADWAVGRQFSVVLIVKDWYGAVSEPAESTVFVRDNVPPAVVLTSPQGGEVLRGDAPIQLRVSHPQAKLVNLEFWLGDVQVQLPDGQASQVWTAADGSFVSVARTFDTAAFADARDLYRMRVVASLDEDASMFDEAFSRTPFSIDNTAPVVTLAEANPYVTEQLDLAGTAVTFHPTVTDNLDAAPRLSVSPQRPSYPLGTTDVTFTATDWAGNTSAVVMQVDIEDSQEPTLVASERVEVEATSPAGTQVDLQASAWDICDADIDITSNAPAGGFAVGEHVVVFEATDDAANTASGQTTVVITDTTPPRIVLPNPPRRNLSQADGFGVPAASVDLPNPTLSDNGYAAGALSCEIQLTLIDAQLQEQQVTVGCNDNLPANRWFPNGETRARYVASDGAPVPNTAEAFFTITVLDDQAPQVIVLYQPSSNEWLDAQDSVRFRVADASDPNPMVTVWPLPEGVDEAQPNGDGVYELVYTDDGSYDVNIQVRDNDGNESGIILDTFGIDRTPPDLQIRQFPVDGVDPNDPETFPVFFVGEQISPRFSAVDLLAGLADLDVRLLPGDRDNQPVQVLSREPVLQGTPRSGPRSLSNLMCDAQPGVCAGGQLSVRELRPGVQRFVITAQDANDNTQVLEVPLRILDLAEAIALVRARIVGYLQGDLSDGVRSTVTTVDAKLAAGQTSLSHGYLGGCMLSLEDVMKPMTNQTVNDEIPGMARNAEILARGVHSDARLFFEEAAEGTSEEADVRSFLTQARNFIIAANPQYGPSILSSQNAYFYSRNGAIPFRATNVASSLQVNDQIIAEMERYLTFDDLAAQEAVSDALWVLSQQVQWKFRELLRAGSLLPRHFIELLFDLQDLAEALGVAENDGVWVRTWQWGIGQMIRVVVDLARAEAAYVLGEDHCKLGEAQGYYDEGIGLLEDRDPDGMLAIYAERDVRCLMLEIYLLADWQPAFPLEEHECEVLGCPGGPQ